MKKILVLTINLVVKIIIEEALANKVKNKFYLIIFLDRNG